MKNSSPTPCAGSLLRFLLAVFLTASCFFVPAAASAQLSTIHDFNGPDGGIPPLDGRLLSLGSYMYGVTTQGGAYSRGTLFRVKADGTDFSVLYNFNSLETDPGSLISDGTYLYGVTSGGGMAGAGTIYKIRTDGTDYAEIIWPSVHIDGIQPRGSLLYDGTYLYGMTSSDNIGGMGSIFKVMPDGSNASTIHYFDNINGMNPISSLVMQGGVLYGMTYEGGANNQGTVFKIMPDGTGFSKLHDFDWTVNGAYPRGSLATDGTALYGLTHDGGAENGGVAFKIMPDGTFTLLANLGDGPQDGASPSGSFYYDGTSLYATTATGGSNGSGAILKIKPDGTEYARVCNFSAAAGAPNLPNGTLISDGTSFYGLANNGLNGQGSVFKFILPPLPPVNTTPAANLEICAGSSTTLSVSGQGTIGWYDAAGGGNYLGSGSIYTTPALPVGTFVFYAQDSLLTESAERTRIDVIVNALPHVSANLSNNPVCEGASVIANGSGGSGVSYSWTGGITNGVSFVPSATASYTVTGTNIYGCTATDSITLEVVQRPTLSATVVPSGCADNDGAIDLSVNGGSPSYEFYWPLLASVDEDQTGLDHDNYTAIVEDSEGCKDTIDVSVPQNCPRPTLISGQCAAIIPNLSGYFNCTPIPGAQDYEWEFTNTGLLYSFSVTRGAAVASILKTQVTGLRFGYAYTVRIKVKIGGVWGDYGNPCAITMGSFPSTQVAASQCGQSVTDLSGYFYCNSIAGAQDYEWEFTNTGGYSFTVARAAAVASIPRTWITGLQFGQSYNVKVRAKVSGDWGTLGPLCQVTIGSPSTQLVTSQCGQQIPGLFGYFNCNAVAGAQDYEWEFSNTGGYSFTIARGAALASIPRTWITGLQPGQNYNVKIRTKLSGVWGAQGPACQVMIDTSYTQLVLAQCGQTMNLSGYYNCNAVAGAQDYEWEFVDASSGYYFTRLRGAGVASIARYLITGLQNGKTYQVRIKSKVGGVWSNYGPACTITVNTGAGSFAVDVDANRAMEEEGDVIMTELNVYPNPFTTKIALKLSGTDPGLQSTVEVFNLVGERQLLRSFTGLSEELNLDHLSNGIYFISVTTANEKLTKKIVKSDK